MILYYLFLFFVGLIIQKCKCLDDDDDDYRKSINFTMKTYDEGGNPLDSYPLTYNTNTQKIDNYDSFLIYL